MLRRRMLLLVLSSYRWATAKVRSITDVHSNPIVTSAVEAESERSTVVRRLAIGKHRPAEDGNAADYSVFGRTANPDVHDATEGTALKRFIIHCKSFAYSALEAPGLGGVRVIILRLASAVAAAGKVASRAVKLVINSSGIGESADGTEANSFKVISYGGESDAVIATGKEALSSMFVTIEKITAPISTLVALASSVSEIQNGEHNKPALFLENYMDGNVLVLRQTHNAILTDDVLGITCVENYSSDDTIAMWQVYDAISAGNVLGVTCSENYANDDTVAMWQAYDAVLTEDVLEVH